MTEDASTRDVGACNSSSRTGASVPSHALPLPWHVPWRRHQDYVQVPLKSVQGAWSRISWHTCDAWLMPSSQRRVPRRCKPITLRWETCGALRGGGSARIPQYACTGGATRPSLGCFSTITNLVADLWCVIPTLPLHLCDIQATNRAAATWPGRAAQGSSSPSSSPRSENTSHCCAFKFAEEARVLP